MEEKIWKKSGLKSWTKKDTSDLFSGEEKNNYLNRSDDWTKLFEDIQDALWNAIQLMEDIRYMDATDNKLWWVFQRINKFKLIYSCHRKGIRRKKVVQVVKTASEIIQ